MLNRQRMTARNVIIALCCLLYTGVSLAEKASNELQYDARLSTYNYQLETKTFAIKSQGQTLEMSYAYLPGQSNKPTVTLLHGKNFNGDYWTETAKFLNGQGYAVLIPDQIGFGKSSKPINYQYTFAGLAANTRALQASLSIDQSIVVGHSMGGMLASRYALMYPEATKQLILVNPIGLENYLYYTEHKDVDFFYQMEKKKSREAVVNYQRKNYYDGAWNARYEKLTDFLVGQIQGPDWDQLAKVNALTYDMIFSQPVIDEFENFQIPTTLIIGTRDRTGPGRNWQKPNVDYELGRYDRLGEITAEKIPNARLYTLENLGHLPQVEDFSKFTQVLEDALNPTD